MLQRIGDSLHSQRYRWFWYITLGALALVFAAWGAYGAREPERSARSTYAAEADGTKIPLDQARNAWQRQQLMWQQRLGGAEIPPELKDKLQDQTLEKMIETALLDKRTQDLGYRVSQQQMHEAILNEPAFQISGQYSADAAKAALAQAGMSIESFEGQLRTDLRRAQLEGGIRASNFLTPGELARLSDLQGQEREVRYFVLPADRFAAAAKVDDAAVAAYYKAHQAQFMTLESAHLQYAELRLESLATQQPVSDADLHAAYEQEQEPAERAGEAPCPPHPDHRQGRCERARPCPAGAGAGQGRQGFRRTRQAVLAGSRFRARTAVTWAGPSAVPSWRPSPMPCSACRSGRSRARSRPSSATTSSGWMRCRRARASPSRRRARIWMRSCAVTAPPTASGRSRSSCRPSSPSRVPILRRSPRSTTWSRARSRTSRRVPGAAPLGAAPQLQEVVFADPPLANGHIGGPVLLGDDRLVIVKMLEHHAPEPKPLAQVHDAIVAAITKEDESQAALKAAQAAREKLAARGLV